MSDQTPRHAESLPPPPLTLHFIGIGGIGMSGLAHILQTQGYTITGSDVAEGAQVLALREAGIPVVIGHNDPTYAGQANIIVTNRRAAANASVELDAALANGARVIKRGDVLGMVADAKTSVCVAGSHGKSSTSGMIATALIELDANPSYAVGAILAATGTNADEGSGAHMVVEADEFDHSFLGLFPDVAIITSIAFDHPDIFADQADYDAAFVDFARQIKSNGTLIIAGDDAGSLRVLDAINDLGRADIAIQTFGEREDLDWYLHGSEGNWSVTGPDGASHPMPLGVPGRHNARNAVTALAALTTLGFPVAASLEALASYTGIGRRFERKGFRGDVEIIDDYAHHPEEIAAVLQSAREAMPGKRIVAIHQPHTYSRTHSLLREFAESLELADQIVLMDIYGATEQNTVGVSSRHMASLIRKPVVLATTPEDAATKAAALIRPGDVVMTIGAGSVTQVGPLLLAE